LNIRTTKRITFARLFLVNNPLMQIIIIIIIIIINFCRSISDCTSYAYENNIVLGTTQSRHIFSLKEYTGANSPGS
jgi:hypothetical protein